MRLGRVEMGEEAVVAEAQWHRVGRRAQHGIGPKFVARRHDGEGTGCAICAGVVHGHDVPDIVGFDQRDVARQRHQVETFRREAPRRRHDRAGVPFAGALAHDAGAVAGGDGGGRGIDRHHDDPSQLAHDAHGGHHVLEHGERQLLPTRCGEQRGEALFGLRRTLDRHHRADFSRSLHVQLIYTVPSASASAVASTCRASCSRSSSVVISVCAIVTGMPSAAASAPSA